LKTILCTSVSCDATFDPFIVQVEDSDAVVPFLEKWKADGGTAWIDHANDTAKLRKMWNRLEKLPRLQLPCQIDYVLYGWYE
jgi:hypothetical protein